MILPGLRELLSGLAKHPSFEAALAACRGGPGQTIRLTGLNSTAKALYTVLLAERTAAPVVAVVNSNIEADRFAETAGAFSELLEVSAACEPFALHSQDVTPYEGLSPHPEIAEKRAVGLWRMADGGASVVVTTMAAVLQKVAAPELYRNLGWKLEVGDEFFLEDLEDSLVRAGYSRHEPVDMVGQFSVRGGIVDVYSPEDPNPVRLEMFGDQLESIRQFEPTTQKSVQRLEQVTLLPLTEYPIPRDEPRGDEPAAESSDTPYIPPPGWEFHSDPARETNRLLWGLLDDPVIVWNEKAALDAEAEKLWDRLESAYERAPEGVAPPGAYYHRLKEIAPGDGRAVRQVEMNEVAIEAPGALHIPTRPPPRFQGNIAHAMREMQAKVREGSRTLITGASLGDVERLADMLGEYEISFQLGLRNPTEAATPFLQEKAYFAGPVAGTILIQAPIRRGAVFPDAKTILYGTEDLFGSSELVARPRKRKSAVSTFLSDLQDLSEGDFVVHSDHGIARYLGTREIEQGGRTDEFMLLEYADRARLYLPLSRLDLVQKYHGAGGAAPTLDRMGGQTWKRTKSRVKARLLDMADELLKLYAGRKLAEGHSFSADSNWQREFEDAFAFTETPDQIQTVKEIKSDMESAQPMDRLVCGDVGFGKTEVAMRATFKALGDGKQVAMLTPTTVLALQHHETFKRRFAAFPVEIEMLTRFRTPTEQKKILERLAAAKLDVVIGTHRLLSKDVVYSDLGLLIVDEEQRFGVRHKERLKQIKKNVDVLTLSATPIPRTLHMSFAGLRDLSIIQTPPKDRLAIHTVVSLYSDQIVETAIRREIDRDGQVYFIHNRVESIWAVASQVQELVPDARIGVGHGQMAEKELERVMMKFIHHEYDVLLATTIVENGLDIPLANTIIINHADRYGLAELYQLRGRVGRSNRRAYAFLLIPENRELSEKARKRLAALKEFSELGAGFKIAALDLELRGAGNLLGAQQHGQIAAVGFETYCRMLDETVRELQGEEVETFGSTSLKLQLDLHIPSDYIRDETQRLQSYKRLAEVGDDAGRREILEGLKDRYGPIPTAVENLAAYSLLKTAAQRIGVESIERRGTRVCIRFRDNSKVNPERLMQFVAAAPQASFSTRGELEWETGSAKGPDLLAALRDLPAQLAE